MTVQLPVYRRRRASQQAEARPHVSLGTILLFFLVAPSIVACMQTSLQVPVMSRADVWPALGFALLFNVPGMFTAWLTTRLLARLPGLERLPMVGLLMVGFLLSLLIFRPYNQLVFETIALAAPQLSHFSGALAEKTFWQHAERFLLINVPGTLTWTVLNLLFMEKFGFPFYREAHGAQPAASASAPMRHADAGAAHPEICHAAGILLEDLQAISAEEHYLRLHTRFGSRLIRHSFRAALAQMPDGAGLQVHRSHWVAFGKVRAVESGKPVQLRLADGTAIPVSSSYEKAVVLTSDALIRH
jgi:hypothetical protein